MQIWTWPDNGDPAWFYGGNGFPLGFYEPLMAQLSSRMALCGLHNRACWPGAGGPTGRDGWARYGADLAQAIRGQGQGAVLGIGHSQGACSMVLAQKADPGLFRALVLIEPAIVSPHLVRLSRVLPKWAGRYVKPVRAARDRRDRWDNVAAYLADLQAHPAYRRFDELAWQAVAAHGVVPDGAGVRLAFPKAWEAHNFFHGEAVLADIETLDIPVAVIRGRASYFFPDPLWHELQRLRPDIVTLEDARFGHLLPIEAAGVSAALVDEALARLGF
ncbi:alpha/beta hydrolase [Aliiroseovarius subalbicans]|uniref:alpha/beta fold hydrolase n=1 Tax=Aliiroseovarius subalbicans TaxID=2925840 RepID=UPI001F59AE3A|nr:alpha/beta hydrolase [Aliiroseovarius subalbicans]MCI2399201.1 alpha/beta hydrolase [Aliiroseovarius subalbicans]